MSWEITAPSIEMDVGVDGAGGHAAPCRGLGARFCLRCGDRLGRLLAQVCNNAREHLRVEQATNRRGWLDGQVLQGSDRQAVALLPHPEEETLVQGEVEG